MKENSRDRLRMVNDLFKRCMLYLVESPYGCVRSHGMGIMICSCTLEITYNPVNFSILQSLYLLR